MINTVKTRDNDAVSTLLRVLPDELQPRREGELVWVAIDGEVQLFWPLWVGEGLPADARRGRNEIAHRLDLPHGVLPVVVARRISPGAHEVLEPEGISWADASGRARIVVPRRLYLMRLEPIRADARRGFKWSAAAETIAETILTSAAGKHGPGVPIGRVIEIAAQTQVSAAHVARVLRQFDEQRYTVKTGAERGSTATRELRDPGRMLSDWAGNYVAAGGPGTGAEFHVPWRDATQSIALLGNAFAGLDWAVTSEVAADRIEPYLTSVPTLEAYVPQQNFAEARNRLAAHPDATEVETGGRIRLFPADPHVLRLTEDEGDGMRVVSPVRVYADLLRHGGRSAEAAEQLREASIGF